MSDVIPREPVQPPGAEAFSMPSVVELDRMGVVTRVGFAGLFGLASLLVIPWAFTAAWMAAIVIWEALSVWVINPWTVRLPARAGVAAFASRNVVGGTLYGLVALDGLAIGTPLGTVMGAVWLCGAFMNNFVYHGENRRILIASLAPSIGIAILGPQLGHGVTLGSVAVSGLILSMFLAARAFSVDHHVLLKRLGERQTALAEVERKLSLAIDASGDGTFEVDLVSGQSRVTAGWARMMGYEPDEVADDLFSYIHPEDAPAVQQAFEVHFAGESLHTATEQRMRCKDGGYKWVLARASLVERTNDGRPARVIGTTIDISERKALELDLKAARDVAEEANLAKSMFLATISHEIRTPLNGVLGMAQAMEADELSRVQRGRLGIIRESGQGLLAILNDVLDISKIEAGKLELEAAEFDLQQLAESARHAFTALADAKDIALTLDVAPAARGVCLGDATRVRQILYNLISNALKFTDQGRVAVKLSRRGDEVRLQVSDTGIGIAAENLERLFEKFEQADTSTTRRYGGSGLGLAICRELADMIGGRIEVTSKLGEGTTFVVALPLPRIVGARKAPKPEAARAAPQETGTLRLLAAEDNEINQLVLTTLLGQLGIEPTVVADGAAAVAAWESGDWDAILMDVQMPRMDGSTATRLIRQREAELGRRRTPILALTANAMSHQAEGYLAAGMDGVVAKPIEVGQLFAALQKVLEDSSMEAAA
jgi:PAS domain S-box-containing protein